MQTQHSKHVIHTYMQFSPLLDYFFGRKVLLVKHIIFSLMFGTLIQCKIIN
jgi:hypothetical protein